MDEAPKEKIRIEIHKGWLGPVAMGIGLFAVVAAFNEMFKQSRAWGGYDGNPVLMLGGAAAIFFAVGFYVIWCR